MQQSTGQGTSADAAPITALQQAELKQLQSLLQQLNERPVASEAQLAMEERRLNIQHKQETFAGVAAVALAFPLVIAIAIRIIRRGHREVAAQPLEGDRLARLEQAVDAIALEIERIGEAQRFQTKLMSEGAAPKREIKSPARVATPV